MVKTANELRFTMKIERKLKHGTFGWDDETKTFTVEYKGQSIKLNKVYAFAFLRFAFSVAQRNWFRKQEKPKKVEISKQLNLSSHPEYESQQDQHYSLYITAQE